MTNSTFTSNALYDIVEFLQGGNAGPRLDALPTDAPSVSTTAPEVDRFGYGLHDVLVDGDGIPVHVELNGAHAALSSVIDGDLPRVRHLVDSLLARKEPPRGVVLVAFTPTSLHVVENIARGRLVADELTRRLGRPVHRLSPAEPAAEDDELVVVVGPFPAIANEVTLDAGEPRWRGRHVAALAGTNLLAELARRQALGLDEVLARFGPDRLHDGALTGAVLDRAMQARLAHAAGLRVTGDTTALWDEAAAVASAMSETTAILLKVDGTSGGDGIGLVPALSGVDDVRAVMDRVVERLREKHGSQGVDSMCERISIVELVECAPYPATGGARFRWDLRLQVLVRPGAVDVRGAIARLCPDPIGPALTRGSAIANLSNRPPSTARLVAPLELLGLVGAPLGVSGAELYGRIVEATAELARRAAAS